MKNKLANTVMEYVILIGTVSLVFATMNMYIKRGFQARVADMTDYFIGREHAADSNPTAETTVDSSTIYHSTATTDLFEGGRMRLALLDNANTASVSRTVDNAKASITENFIPAERGNITVPERPTEEDIQEVYDTEAESIKAQIRRLEIQRDNLLLEARILEEKARIIDSRGRQLISRANRMDCDDSRSCRRARSRMKSAGQQMVKDAAAAMQQVAEKRADAGELQDQIDELEKQQ